MSLVDYSSDDEEEEEDENRGLQDDKETMMSELTQQHFHSAYDDSIASSSSSFPAAIQVPVSEEDIRLTSKNAEEVSIRLPDASELFSSFNPGATLYPIRAPVTVAAALSRKRPVMNGSADSRHNKTPKGNLPPARTHVDTASGFLVPPQLRGRSNVVTEDLGRLFTKRQSS